MNIGEVCQRGVVTVSPEATIVEAARLMRTAGVGDLVVVEVDDQGLEPIGMITDRDIVVEVVAADPEDLTLPHPGRRGDDKDRA